MKENKAGLPGAEIREGLELQARGESLSGALSLSAVLMFLITPLGSFQKMLVLDIITYKVGGYIFVSPQDGVWEFNASLVMDFLGSVSEKLVGQA